MSSNYSVSTSESSSFINNPALNHTQSRNTPSDAAVARTNYHINPAVTTTTESSTRNDAVLKKAVQPTKSATSATAQESPSMTIRRVPTDYSKRMEDQKARSNALERYKMLVKANRLVPSDRGTSPDPNKAKESGETDLSTTWRRSEQMPLSVQRDTSVATQTVLSDVSDDDIEAAAASGPERKCEGCKSQQELHKSADLCPSHSVSGLQQQQLVQQRERSSSSPVPVSVSMRRTACTNSVTWQQDEGWNGDEAQSAAAPAVATMVSLSGVDLTKTLAYQPTQQQRQPPSAMQPSTDGQAAAPEDSGDPVVDYVSPELTQPYSSARPKPRNSLRPGYDPVTERRDSSLTHTSSFTAEGQRSPGKQPTPQQLQQQPSPLVRSHSGVGQGLLSASSAGSSTPRRKSTAKVRSPATTPPAVKMANTAAVAFDQGEESKTKHVEAASEAQQAEQLQDHGAPQPQQLKTGDGVVPLPGSKTAFWVRPSSAMYEMTTSIAAKRRDHVEADSATTRTSSRRGSRASHATPSGRSGSLCGAPRNRDNSAAAGANAAAVVEEKPRFSTHLSAADRKLYEEGKAAAANPPAVPTYDTIFSNRQSTVQRSSSRRSQKMKSTTVAGASAISSTVSLTPRGIPRSNSQRPTWPRVDLKRSSSAASHLSSNQQVHTPMEEAGRVSARQQDALTKHCARVAARAEEPAAPTAAGSAVSAEAKTSKVKKRAPTISVKAIPASLQQPKRTPVPPAKVNSDMQKARDYKVTGAVEEEGEEPVPRTILPQSSKHFTALHHDANEEAAAAASAVLRRSPSSPHTTVHVRRVGEDTTPSKSRRCEHDITASPPRDDTNSNTNNADDDAHFTAQDASMMRAKEAARAEQAQAALENCRLTEKARAEVARTLHGAGAAVSTNEVIAAIVQGIVQQTRQVLPCYLCGELQCILGYRVHISACRPKTEAILREYFTATGSADTLAEVMGRIERLAAQEVPVSTLDLTVCDTYVKECYQCVKATLVSCRKCGTHLRVQDIKEHEMLCGREYYQSSRAAERVRSAVDRIERGSQD